MVLKFSGTHRHCKGGSSTSFVKSKTLHHHQFRDRSSYLDKDVPSDAGGQYDFIRAAASSSSTPAWDFSSYTNDNVGQYEEEGSSYGGKWIQQQVEEDAVVVEEEGEPKEWMAQVEPGVHITFVSLPGGAGNDLKRIRFRYALRGYCNSSFTSSLTHGSNGWDDTAGRCSTSGRRRGGGGRTTIESWNCTTCSDLAVRLSQLRPDPTTARLVVY